MPNEESQVFRTNSHEEKGINEGVDAKHNRKEDNAGKTRELHDHQQTAEEGKTKHIEVAFGKRIEPELSTDPIAEPAALATPEPAPKAKLAPELELDFKAKDAAPWALSIHLEERIKALGASTASVNRQIDALDAGVQKLKKRTGL